MPHDSGVMLEAALVCLGLAYLAIVVLGAFIHWLCH
jgi:hypothetical protein